MSMKSGLRIDSAVIPPMPPEDSSSALSALWFAGWFGGVLLVIVSGRPSACDSWCVTGALLVALVGHV